jgi:hypothetical protein
MDLVTIPTAGFRPLRALVIVRHGRRELVRCAVTRRPGAPWIVQHRPEAFPLETAPRFLIHDREVCFSDEVRAALRSLTIIPVRTSDRSTWQNSVAERCLGALRRERLDHLIVVDDRHLQWLLDDCAASCDHDQTRLGVGKDAPITRPVVSRPGPGARVVSLPRVGGLRRRHARRRAA